MKISRRENNKRKEKNNRSKDKKNSVFKRKCKQKQMQW